MERLLNGLGITEAYRPSRDGSEGIARLMRSLRDDDTKET
ncbi:hypothetical protein SCH4B_1285 [Ruegeria sp. TrichCH4B]|nr:hypothetical protein SCH4B_1285 [Ruegeria sp. TrichCH4B]